MCGLCMGWCDNRRRRCNAEQDTGLQALGMSSEPAVAGLAWQADRMDMAGDRAHWHHALPVCGHGLG